MKKTIKKDKLTIKICDTNDAMGAMRRRRRRRIFA